MGTLNDEILRATGGPTVNDGLFAYYGANGGVGATLADREKTWLLIQQPTASPTWPINDIWMMFVLPVGGSINDKQLFFWTNA